MSIQKIFKENGLGVIIVILLIAYGVYYFSSYLTGKGRGVESMDSMPQQAYMDNTQQQLTEHNTMVQVA